MNSHWRRCSGRRPGGRPTFNVAAETAATPPWRVVLACLFLANSTFAGKEVVVLNSRLADDAVRRPPIVCWQEVRQSPRLLRVHLVRVDLRATQFELAALIAPDPDGAGPAEARLEEPATLAKQPGVVVAVNANAFGPVPRPPPGERVSWKPHLPVEIVGWAFDGRRPVSAPQLGYISFWVDPTGRPRIGNLDAPVAARVAVAGFGELLREGRIIPAATGPLHPRTAVGVDRDGTTLWLVVVDGRRRGYSEGVADGELAALMRELGGWDALNLDGGGSSILLVDAGRGGLRVMNRPSDRETRPIPVMLAVRRRN